MLPLRRITTLYLGELLLERKIITKDNLNKALEIQKEKGGLLGEVLVGMGLVQEEDIALALTAQYGFPYLPLSNYEIDARILNVVPAQVCSQYCFIPVDIIGNNLTLAMSNPLDKKAIEDIENVTGKTIQVYVATPKDIRQAIEKYYKTQ